MLLWLFCIYRDEREICCPLFYEYGLFQGLVLGVTPTFIPGSSQLVMVYRSFYMLLDLVF